MSAQLRLVEPRNKSRSVRSREVRRGMIKSARDGRYGHVFATERGARQSRLIKRIGERAGFDFLVHAHMLLRLRIGERRTRHQGNPGLARSPLDPELAPTRFKDFWR